MVIEVHTSVGCQQCKKHVCQWARRCASADCEVGQVGEIIYMNTPTVAGRDAGQVVEVIYMTTLAR